MLFVLVGKNTVYLTALVLSPYMILILLAPYTLHIHPKYLFLLHLNVFLIT